MLITPYKGEVVDLMAAPGDVAELTSFASSLPSLQLSQREACDLEMIATGAFSPIRSFMAEADYTNVLANLRLADGTLFPLPITLGVADVGNLKSGADIALRSPANDLLAIMTVSDIFEWDKTEYAETVLGTGDSRHPLVAELGEWADSISQADSGY